MGVFNCAFLIHPTICCALCLWPIGNVLLMFVILWIMIFTYDMSTDDWNTFLTGFSQTPQPVGEKCLLCKRDLSFTPNGPVFQPTISPNVAVLPCGHTFHDHCLQLITPAEQANNPPCIPCAIGES